jgi:hypothetical protein
MSVSLGNGVGAPFVFFAIFFQASHCLPFRREATENQSLVVSHMVQIPMIFMARPGFVPDLEFTISGSIAAGFDSLQWELAFHRLTIAFAMRTYGDCPCGLRAAANIFRSAAARRRIRFWWFIGVPR